ncbi:MAG TPA: transcription termination factor NusA [Aquifex aeolicus]|uniref:Transcription termination/antitermination protein NusA n=1 Tax=Aquifex aeolicus TaxID=63363 RepID=A0A7C5LB52_AQUAO|nr:transcription termination factor NusA [Aquifex aeolicus]
MVKNIKKLIEQVAKEKDLPERVVEYALKNAIAIAVKKDKRLRENLDIEFTDEGIRVYIVRGKERLPLEISTEDINRIAAYAAKEEFLSELERAERERGFLEFKELEGEVVTGIVRKVYDNGDVLVDLGKVDAVLPRREQIAGERYTVGDKVKALLLEVKKVHGEPRLILSRTHPLFLKRLLETEIPEVAEKDIEIKAVARIPGERAKVAVYAKDMKMDPVGIVVGLRGSRIQPISEELSGEKIDVIRWTDDEEEFIRRALSPARPTAVRLIPEEDRAEVAVPQDQLSLAIGKRGTNVKLAHKLTGWHIDVMSEEDFERLTELRESESEE